MEYELVRLVNDTDLRDIPKQSSKPVIVSTQQESLARIAVDRKIDVICNLETATGRDHTHYRRSGATQVLFNLMAENKVGYLIDFNRILSTEPGSKRAILLGRIMQNIRIAQKQKRSIPVYIAGDRTDDMLKAFARVIGTNNPLTLADLIEAKKRKLRYVSKGVRIK